jgi:ketosteroid isomerase-like protein
MKVHSREFSYLRGCACLLAAALILAVSPSEAGQKNKKNNTNASSSSDSTLTSGLPDTPRAESDKINEDIGEMLGAFQVGDVELMHKYYSDYCTFVQSTYNPPVVGWQNYISLYNQEKSAFQGMQLIRRNTNIFIHQDVAWASYQWEFDGMSGGQPFMTRGQTTLVFTKVNGNWLIVHNHTSETMPEPTPPAQQTAAQTSSENQSTPTPAKP